ncbi:MAG: helix-turn-helix transcriptional regulator, partial [Epulopiscium sp.]|nr:helix-turn-helix transcriptional regulator [Candidatus Epulonipiscium sp.]
NHNLIYLSFTSNQTLFNKVTNIQKTMLITILMTLIIGGFVVFLLLRTNYKPIKDLQTLSSSINTKKSNPTKNELDLIRNTIVELSQRNNELEYELEQNILIRQNFLLNQLINGTIGHLENFLLESEKVQLNLTAKYNGIVVVKSPSPITSISSLFTTMNILNHPFCYEYLIQQLPPNIMIFIVGTEETLNTRFPSILLKDEYVISLSTLYINLMQMPKAYIEARTNLELQLFSGSSIQTQTSLFHTVEKFLQKYENKQRTIQELLDLGDTLSLKIFVTKTTHELQQENMNFELIRNIYLEMIILFNTFFEQNKQLFEYPNVDLTTFFEINNKEILQDMFLEIFEDMIVTMNEKSETDLPVLSVSSIKKSILKNYTDCSFSIQLIAEQFNVSASYLSQYFKEKTGSTILEYMTNLKIEKAKELLKNETLTLKDISQQIGYIHVSSFIRRFKQVTNITPSEYRKQSQ